MSVSDDVSGLAEDDDLADLLHLARTEGLREAYRVSLEIARDQTKPAAARGAAARTLLEIGGLLNQRDRAAVRSSKPIHEMDGEELEAAAMAIMKRRLAASARAQTSLPKPRSVVADGAVAPAAHNEGSGVFD